MPLSLFGGLRPVEPKRALRDLLAGVSLSSINIPQVLGYSRIAGTPVVAGLYTLLLPPVAFAIFGSSRHLVVAADSATAAIFSSSLSRLAVPASDQYMGLVCAGGPAARRVVARGANLQVGLFSRFSLAHGADGISRRCRAPGRHRDAERHVRRRSQFALFAGSRVADHGWTCRTCITRRSRCPCWSRGASCSAIDSRRDCRWP